MTIQYKHNTKGFRILSLDFRSFRSNRVSMYTATEPPLHAISIKVHIAVWFCITFSQTRSEYFLDYHVQGLWPLVINVLKPQAWFAGLRDSSQAIFNFLLSDWRFCFPQDMGNCQAQKMLTTEVLLSKWKRTVALLIRDVTPKGRTHGLTHTYATRISLSPITQLTPTVQYNEHSYLALIPAAISSQLGPSH